MNQAPNSIAPEFNEVEEPEWFRQMANIVFDDMTMERCTKCSVGYVEERNGKAVGCFHCDECHSIQDGCL